MSVAVERYEGLVKTTTGLIIGAGVELEFDDVAQLLRIKVWQALVQFDARRAAAGRRLNRSRDAKGRTPQDRFVFICVTNMRRDIEKRPRRYLASIDELRGARALAADHFDARYLASEDHYEVEDELPLPSDLTDLERRAVALRLEGKPLVDLERELGLSRDQRLELMESLRAKLSELDPAHGRRSDPPLAPVPAARPPARTPVVLAA